MAQLIVRNLEDNIVAKLRRRAAQRGVSAEEEHRQILRDALATGSGSTARTLKDYLRAMPSGGADAAFVRPLAKRRSVKL